MRTRLGCLGLVLLVALGWYGWVRIYRAHMHQRVDPGQVDHVVISSNMETDHPPTPEEQALIIRWFNAGKDPRPGEGHTTDLGAVFLYLKDGSSSIGIWPEGQDVLTGQGGHSYFLRQPQLKVLLRSLDQSAQLAPRQSPWTDPDLPRTTVVLEARDAAGRPVRGAAVKFKDFGAEDKTGPDGTGGPYLIAVPDKERFPYTVTVGGCPVKFDGAPDWWNHGPGEPLRLTVHLPDCS